MTTTLHITPDGAVTDVDPTGEVFVIANVEAIPAPDPDSCGLDDGQTHITVVTFDEAGTSPAVGYLDDDEVPVCRDLDDARERARPEDGWRVYRLVPVTEPIAWVAVRRGANFEDSTWVLKATREQAEQVQAMYGDEHGAFEVVPVWGGAPDA